MNIKEVLAHLKSIEESISQATLLAKLFANRPKEAKASVTIQVFNAEGNKFHNDRGNYCVVDADLLSAAIKQTADRHAAEAAKLQPVIDMAEAALKGILSTGDAK